MADDVDKQDAMLDEITTQIQQSKGTMVIKRVSLFIHWFCDVTFYLLCQDSEMADKLQAMILDAKS